MEDGRTRRQHVELGARQGHPAYEAELAAVPDMPRAAAYLWGYFIDLDGTRQNNGFGPSRISRLEIAQWEADEGVRLDPWERRAILNVDAAYVAAALANQPKPKG
jgi:hypothetical protein